MAEEQEEDSKTEEPTEKRISDAVGKGKVPVAQEAALFGSIAAILLALLLLGGWTTSRILDVLQAAFEAAGHLRIDDREATTVFISGLVIDLSLTVLPLLGLLASGAILAALLQNAPSIAQDRIKPQWSRISPASGWKRLFGTDGLMAFLKSVMKLAAVAAILWILFRKDLPLFISSLSAEPSLLPGAMRELATGVVIPLLILAMFFAMADLVWSRWRWRKGLRMTRQELKDEMKEAEGDPYIKARTRSIGRQRASRRMLDKLPQASVVITNPTHYAVALRYVREDGGAPVVVAKGVDHMALKIREIASGHAIPLIENRPLARSLYDQVEIDQQIPPEFYRAVAEIIHYLNSRSRLPRRSPAT